MRCSSTVYEWYMLNCIIATTLPKSGTNAPSTPVSFMRRSSVSGSCDSQQEFDEDAVGLLVGAHIRVDELQRAAHLERGGSGAGVDCCASASREHPQQVDRILGEHIRMAEDDAVVLGGEILVEECGWSCR